MEDEENLHEALKLNLELEGYEVTGVYDGAEALKTVQQEFFNLITCFGQKKLNLTTICTDFEDALSNATKKVFSDC